VADRDAQKQLALIAIERERRRRLEQPEVSGQPMPESPTIGQRAGQALQGLGSVAEEMNVGMMSVIPGAVPAMQKAGLFREDEQAMGGARGQALRFAGTAIPFAAGVPALGTAPGKIQGGGIIRGMVDDIANFARQRPGAYFGSELGAAAAAGAAGEIAREAGEGEGVALGSEVAGGILGSLAIGKIPAGVRSLRDTVTSNLLPMTKEGGTVRAARQMQQRAGGAERAEEFARMLDTIPEGVTPAQWIGDSRLMAQEARILIDNPDLEPIVRQELQQARLAAQESLRDQFGRPRNRQQWELSVLQRVSPDGANIQLGMTDEMLEQAYQSFRPLYDAAKGFPVEQKGLRNSVVSAANDDAIIASDGEREAVRRWLANQITAIEGRDVPITTDDLLNVRSRIRDERRRQVKSGNQERADLLNSAEYELTQRIESVLPDDVRQIVRDADSQYRKYKVVENSIFNAGDSALTPEQLSESIRMGGLTSQSRYARGQDEAVQELRDLALAGRSTEEVIGDPRRASLFVRGLDSEGKKAVQADFMDVLFSRSMARSTDTTDAGVPFVSGRQLVRDIQENREVMRSLGMSDQDIGRALRVSREISQMETKAPGAVAQLLEDGPAAITQLAAALVGAKQGQALAGKGLGSSLVLAQFMSNRARGALARLTSQEAERLMKEATTDPELYKALLTSGTTPRQIARERAAYLESWLLSTTVNAMQEDNQ
jgi:hypothetical protein